MKFIDLTGRRFGRLVALRVYPQRNKYGAIRWQCICDCKKIHKVTSSQLLGGSTRSCGCLYRETRNPGRKKHGHAANGGTRTYQSWHQIIQRTLNPRNARYPEYGGRGITVCERWRKFENFLKDMGAAPAGKTIDRYPDRNGIYEKTNCRWATYKEQSDNSSSPRWITHNHETHNLTEWAKKLGITPSSLHRRLVKWPVSRALTK